MMELKKEEVLELKNAIQSSDGWLIITYLHNLLTDYSKHSNLSAECLRGMGIFIQDLKEVKTHYEQLKERN